MEKFCMYLKKTEPVVTFKSGEHIFPAGIGGIQKLPMEYVSHNANNAFSAMEGQVMKKSLLALPRQFVGPGKRGNITNPKKATQGAVSLMSGVINPKTVEFGYISLGRPYSISQIKININGSCQFISDKSFGDVGQQTTDFTKNLGNYNGRYTLHEDERFSQDEFLLGVHEGKWYVGLSNKDLELEVANFVKKLVEQKPFEKHTPDYGTVQPRVHQTLEFDDRYFRVCSKTIFNYLAFVKGRDFVLQDCFDPIRDWIVNGGENKFATLTGKETDFSAISFPDQAHKLLITQKGNILIGHISFYGNGFETEVKLSDNFEGLFNLEGFICDWQNRQEYKLLDYLNSRVER